MVPYKGQRLKLILLALWLLFTASMVTWWWVYGLHQFSAGPLSAAEMERRTRMITMEGATFLAAIVFGGTALWIYIQRDQKRNDQLRVFFSTFSHDIKTSIARLRLQAEVLQESPEIAKNTKLQRLLTDINRLDLQLENSLLLSRNEEEGLFMEDLPLGKFISLARADWPELEIRVERDATLRADKRALLSVFRNLIYNSILHGSATRLELRVKAKSANVLEIEIQDNGTGYSGEVKNLGRKFLNLRDGEELQTPMRGTGVGLYLSRLLIERMRGNLEFQTSAQGFVTVLRIGGSLK